MNNLRKKFYLVPSVKNINKASDKIEKKLFKKIIIKANRLVNNWEGKMYFVYLPSHKTYLEGTKYENQDYIFDFIKKLNIPIIDAHKEVFLLHKDPVSLFPLRIDGHYNSEGYKLISNKIKERLVEDGYLPLK